MKGSTQRTSYERFTKEKYQFRSVAEEYHRLMKGEGGIRSLRGLLVTHRERAIIRSFLSDIPHDSVIDVPAGTGKLAPVFKSLDSDVLSCDISKEMLRLAKQTYAAHKYERVSFRVADVEALREEVDEPSDVVVCLRLLHLVPPSVQRSILHEISQCAPYAVISSSCYRSLPPGGERIRRSIVRSLGEDVESPYTREFDSFLSDLQEAFDVLEYRRKVPFLSLGVVFQLESTNY